MKCELNYGFCSSNIFSHINVEQDDIFKGSRIIMAVNGTARQPERVVIHFPEYFFTVEVNASCFLWKS